MSAVGAKPAGGATMDPVAMVIGLVLAVVFLG